MTVVLAKEPSLSWFDHGETASQETAEMMTVDEGMIL